MFSLTIATRRSPLALRQSEFVAQRLQHLSPSLQAQLLPLQTEGDKRLQESLATIGGKGLFVKEVQQALLEGRADLAVHSLKDMPTELPDELQISALLPRQDPRDVVVSREHKTLEQLPTGARIGSSSSRRQGLLLARFPKLQTIAVRGNLGTRLKRLQEGHCDALLLAAAGLQRLGKSSAISEYLSTDIMLPAACQGVLAVESRRDNARLNSLLLQLDDPDTRNCVAAERAFVKHCGGGCQLPLACYAQLTAGELFIQALIVAPDGRSTLRAQRRGKAADGALMGQQLGEELLAQGGTAILAQINAHQ